MQLRTCPTRRIRHTYDRPAPYLCGSPRHRQISQENPYSLPPLLHILHAIARICAIGYSANYSRLRSIVAQLHLFRTTSHLCFYYTVILYMRSIFWCISGRKVQLVETYRLFRCIALFLGCTLCASDCAIYKKSTSSYEISFSPSLDSCMMMYLA